MELLMTPAEAAEAAFGSGDAVGAGIVTEGAVREAQQNYLRPVLGLRSAERWKRDVTGLLSRNICGLRSPCS